MKIQGDAKRCKNEQNHCVLDEFFRDSLSGQLMGIKTCKAVMVIQMRIQFFADLEFPGAQDAIPQDNIKDKRHRQNSCVHRP